MKIQTFSIVVGTAACNAHCPFCVSKMTGKELSLKETPINWRNFEKACQLAKRNKVSTVLITGKGEPTLFPEQVTKFLKQMKKFEFPLIEIQTNALVFGKEFQKYKKYLKTWYNNGLTTIAISIVDYRAEKNKQIYTKNSDYIDLVKTIKSLHKMGFSIRLCCMMAKGFIDNVEKLKKLIDFSRKNKVEQLTIRTIATPKKAEDSEIYKWTKKHSISKKNTNKIKTFLEKNANKLMTLDHGAIVYDYLGQNICNSDCLTIKPKTSELRQLIFFPDGHLRYDWQYKGAILL